MAEYNLTKLDRRQIPIPSHLLTATSLAAEEKLHPADPEQFGESRGAADEAADSD